MRRAKRRKRESVSLRALVVNVARSAGQLAGRQVDE